LDAGPLGGEHGNRAVGAPVVISKMAAVHEPAVVWEDECQYNLGG
jgi:hypothetical protein